MGEARKRRLTLIKGGKAAEAKLEANNSRPQNLRSLTVLITQALDKVVTKVYDERVNKAALPSRNDFIERLIIAGLDSFRREEMKQAEESHLVKLAGPDDMTQIAGKMPIREG